MFRNLIRWTDEIPPITNRRDTRAADLAVGATFGKSTNGFDPEVLGVTPPTGTMGSRADQPRLDRLLAIHRSERVYLERSYANDVFYPMWFKHFGSETGGAGMHIIYASSERLVPASPALRKRYSVLMQSILG